MFPGKLFYSQVQEGNILLKPAQSALHLGDAKGNCGHKECYKDAGAFRERTSHGEDTPGARCLSACSARASSEARMASRQPARMPALLGVSGGDAVFGTGKFFFEAIVEPVLEMFLRSLGYILKAKSSAAFDVGPNHFGFNVEVELGLGKRELQAWSGAFGQGFAQDQGDAALTDVGGMSPHHVVGDHDADGHLHRVAEVAAALLHHEVQGGMEAAGGV